MSQEIPAHIKQRILEDVYSGKIATITDGENTVYLSSSDPFNAMAKAAGMDSHKLPYQEIAEDQQKTIDRLTAENQELERYHSIAIEALASAEAGRIQALEDNDRLREALEKTDCTGCTHNFCICSRCKRSYIDYHSSLEGKA